MEKKEGVCSCGKWQSGIVSDMDYVPGDHLLATTIEGPEAVIDNRYSMHVSKFRRVGSIVDWLGGNVSYIDSDGGIHKLEIRSA
ncbi:hypothetical protein HYV64_05250 [Candidatus Shapirobacteria bacterium]|nr:hypothetical protein [Candidatus Shapirobacteria bacterium]